LHQLGVHAEKGDRQSISKELLLDGDSLSDDLLDESRRWLVLEMLHEQTSKVGVHTLVTGDELIREGQARHQT
jgi:hypothetical protein